MAIHVMFDIETLGVSSGCAVLQIGAVQFDEGFNILKTIRLNINPKDSAKEGFFADQGTIEWWKNQSEEARKSVSVDSKPILSALKEFSDWIPKGAIGWCHNNFDAPILEFAFKKMRVMLPFAYTNICDLRTMQKLANLDTKSAQKIIQRIGTHHDALDDSIFQMKVLRECFERLGLKLSSIK